MRARCTNDVRSVSRLENDAASIAWPSAWKKRPEIPTVAARSSSILGSISGGMHQGFFLMRGLANVRAEFLA